MKRQFLVFKYVLKVLNLICSCIKANPNYTTHYIDDFHFIAN